jgi:hypothetical protein
MSETEWRVIERFPEYEVNNRAEVRNIKSGHVLRLIFDPKDKQAGLKVGVRKDGKRIHIPARKLRDETFEKVEVA